MISEVWALKDRLGHVNNIYVDASNPEIIQALKREFEEAYDDKTIKEKIAYAKKNNLHVEDQMFVVPVAFAVEGVRMLAHVKWLLEEKEDDGSSLVAIDRERFHKLVTSLRTAYANQNRLDKEMTVYPDLLDAF